MRRFDPEKLQRAEALFAEAEQAAATAKRLEAEADELKQRAADERATYARCREQALALIIPPAADGMESAWVR